MSANQTKIHTRLLRTKGTWQMTDEELARVFAGHYGWEGREGGWIYDEKGRPVVQGWTRLAAELTRRNWIIVGKGINWRKIPETPTFGGSVHYRRSAYDRWERKFTPWAKAA